MGNIIELNINREPILWIIKSLFSNYLWNIACISGALRLKVLFLSFSQKLSYWMNISNCMELCAFTAALITVAGRDFNYGDKFEITFGVFSVMLTYITLLTYLQR